MPFVRGSHWYPAGGLQYNWRDIAVSSTGQHVTAVASRYVGSVWQTDAGIYVSNDYGATWSMKQPAPDAFWKSVRSVGMDSTGQYQTVMGWGGIRVSSDYGATWSTPAYALSGDIRRICVITPTLQYAVLYGSYVHKTTDGWATGSARTTSGTGSWVDLSGSADGQYLMAVGESGERVVSTDGGVNFAGVPALVANPYRSVVLSTSGQYAVVARDSVDGTSRNNNYLNGGDWAYGTNSEGINLVATYGTGQIVTGLSYSTVTDSTVYHSSDYGATWSVGVSQVGPRLVNVFRVSADGTKFWAVSGGRSASNTNLSYIYTSEIGAVQAREASTLADTSQPSAINIYQLSEGMTAGTAPLTLSPEDRQLTETATLGVGAVAGKDPFQYKEYGLNWELVPETINGGTASTEANAAISTSGQHQVLCRYLEYVRTSSDYGATWTDRTAAGKRGWRCVAISDGGQYVTAAVSLGGNGFIYVSADYGATWNDKTSTGTQAWRGIAMSTSGQYQTAVASGNYIYRSTDYGVTWASVAGPGTSNWNGIAVSETGQYQVATTTSSGSIYQSSDYGATWTPKAIPSATYNTTPTICNPSSIRYIYTGISGSPRYYVSTDSGANWAAINSPPVETLAGFVISRSGTSLFALGYPTATPVPKYTFYSDDGGASWVARAAISDWAGPIRFMVGSGDLSYMLTNGSSGGVTSLYRSVAGEASAGDFGAFPILTDTMHPSPNIINSPTDNTAVLSDVVTTGGSEITVEVPEETGPLADEAFHLTREPFLEEAMTEESVDAFSLSAYLDEDAVIDDLAERWFELNITAPALEFDLGVLRVDYSAQIVNNFAIPVFMTKTFDNTAAKIYNCIWTRISKEATLRSTLATYTDRFDIRKRIYNSLLVAAAPSTTVLRIEYKVMLDDLYDVTNLVTACTISYDMQNFVADVDVTWAHTSLEGIDGDTSLYDLLDCSDFERNYRRERLAVWTRVASNVEPEWILQGRFFLEKRSTSIVFGTTTPSSWGRSRPALLSMPFAQPITREWLEDTTALAIAQELCDDAGVTLSWEISDFRVLGSNMSAEGSEPVEIISTLAAAIGGVLTCDKNGVLRVVYRYL